MNQSTSHHLVGRIHHVITPKDTNTRCSLKRPRPWESENDSSNQHDRRGLVFICEQSNERVSSGTAFQLVLPLLLTRDACRAAIAGELVQITQYSLVCYRDGIGEVVFDSREIHGNRHTAKHFNDADSSNIFVVEVHRGGLIINSSGDEKDETATTTSKKNHASIPAITLEMLSKKEHHSNKKRKSSNKQPMNITATIDAISPILVSDTSDKPFAIMELYQPDSSPTYSAVAVLRGENVLSMHPALLPGESIMLRGVITRSWKVPDAFLGCKQNDIGNDDAAAEFYERLYQRTPDRVILVEETSSIQCDEGHDESSTLPSTVESLTSIRGVIDSVNFYQYDGAPDKKTEHIIHFVTMKDFTIQNSYDTCKSVGYDSNGNEIHQQPRIARINLLKYAFSPHVLIGMQPGAVIRAVNIHCSTSPSDTEQCYLACLRSTVSIERCAGESSYCNKSIRFIPTPISFSLLPHHRIERLCSDLSNSKTASQYVEEEHLRSKVELFIGNSVSAAWQVRALLSHHRNSGRVSRKGSMSSDKGKDVMRDPYAEFFDHAHSHKCGLEKECGSSTRLLSAFQCHECVSTGINMPNVVRLNALRDVCVKDFIQRLASSCTSDCGGSVSAGWTSSYHYYSSRVYVWGNIDFTASNSGRRPAGVVYNDLCRIPVSILEESNFKSAKNSKEHYLGWFQVKSALVSCLCLGRGTNQNRATAANKDYGSLPHIFLRTSDEHTGNLQCGGESISGHVFVFTVSNLVFIGSIQLVGIPLSFNDSIHCNTSYSDILPGLVCKNTTIHQRRPLSIKKCLEQTGIETSESSVSIRGRLIRQRFQFRKAKLAYEGWTITLSHIDCSQNGFIGTDSILQTIDVHISIPIAKSRSSKSDTSDSDTMNKLKSALTDLFPSDNGDHAGNLCRFSSDQLTMGLAFWQASNCNWGHPLLSGGRESCNNRFISENDNFSVYQSSSVFVEIPLSSRVTTKLGYQRFRCHLEDVQSFIVLETFDVARSSVTESPQLLEFSASSGKFLPGTLSRRLHRVKQPCAIRLSSNNAQVNKVDHSPCSVLAQLNGRGVPIADLASLHWEICQVLKEKQPFHLRPSLLRRIDNAKILGISFSRARVECTKCFEFLTTSHSEEKTLTCPSGCSSLHAAVKWESSVLIDDGTGQSKVYAEREAALLLLGSSLDVAAVEEGAWMCQDGVFFQPSLPLSSYLQRCIKDASIKARREHVQRMSSSKDKRRRKGQQVSMYSFLDPMAKAEYALHHHCRQWYQTHGHLQIDLFCRCKPLSTDATTVNQTEIQVAKAIDGYGLDFGPVQTFTLPPLKLILEDVCLASDDKQDERLSWDMLRYLKRS